MIYVPAPNHYKYGLQPPTHWSCSKLC